MKSTRRATTIYLDSRLAQAVKIKAAVSGKSISALASEGLARILQEDERDLRTFRERRKERVYSYEDVLKELRRDGLLPD